MNDRQTTPRVRWLFVVALLLLAAAPGWGQSPAAVPSGDELVVPGSPQDYWAAGRLAGAAPGGPAFLLDFVRALEAMELHDSTRLRAAQQFLTSSARRASAASFRLPLPIKAAVWLPFVSRGAPSEVFAAAMLDRRVRRFLYGAAALDPETRAYLEATPALVERLVRSHSDVFVVYGRSFHVRGGRVEVPGGPAAVELWELLVGAPASAPTAFLDRLLAADTGELAAFYDTVAHLDGPHQRFALSLWMPDAGQRRARALTLYTAVRSAGRRVLIPHQPFVRTDLDLRAVLAQFRVLDNGRPAAPADPAFWRTVFVRVERWPDVEWNGAPSGSSVDATWFVEVVLLSARPIWNQAATVAFAQRLAQVDASGRAAIPDPANPRLAGVVRLFASFPALALSLERAGLRDADAYRTALDRAATLRASGRMYWHRQVLAQYQGALALVTQLRLADRLPVAAAERLVTSLARLELRNRAYAGGVARWIATELLPALGADPAAIANGESEHHLLAALAGAPRDDADMPRLRWEDWDYRIDSSRLPLERLSKVRTRQGGSSLDAVLALWQAAERLTPSVSPAGGRADPAPQAVWAQAAASLRRSAAALRDPRPPSDGTGRDALGVKAAVTGAAASLERLRDARDLGAIRERILTAVDVATADVILSLLYAVHVGDPDSPLWLEGDVAQRHDFGLMNRDGLDPDVLAWSSPVEETAPAWHVRGALFDLDVALSRLRLPQVAAGGPPAPPVLAPDDQRVFVESVALFAPDGDAAMQAVAEAIAAGRARVTAAAAGAEALDRLAGIGRVGEWRRHYLLPWFVAREPAAVAEAFSLTELYWVGVTGRVAVPEGADTWGAPALPVGGCRCLRVPEPQAWEDVAGRAGAVPSVLADGTLRLAELLSDLRLPAVLARHLYPLLMREFLDRVQMVHSDDWMSVTRYWAAVPRARVEDAMGELTVDGPLVANAAPAAR